MELRLRNTLLRKFQAMTHYADFDMTLAQASRNRTAIHSVLTKLDNAIPSHSTCFYGFTKGVGSSLMMVLSTQQRNDTFPLDAMFLV
jgi:hypothetical protein